MKTSEELNDAAIEIEEAMEKMDEALEIFNNAIQKHEGCRLRAESYCSSIIKRQVHSEGYEMYTMEDALNEMREGAEELSQMEADCPC